MAANKSRIESIATARCIGILLVVFGHSFPFGVHILPAASTLQAFIYAFHMPLFVFLSGYLLVRNQRPAGQYICRRSIRLLVPYFVLSVAAFIPKMLVQQFLNDTVEFTIWYLVKTQLIPRDNVWGHFWYIPVIYLLGCAGVLMQKPMHKYRAVSGLALIVTCSFLFLPQITPWLAMEDIRKTAFFFILGMVAADWDPGNRVASNRCWLLALPVAVTIYAFADAVLTETMIACLMIGFVLHIGTGLHLKKHSVFSAIEKNSFTIFLLSWPAQAVVEVLCNKLLHFPVLLTMAIMFLAGVGAPLLCVKIVSLLEKRFPVKWVKLIIGM